MNIRDIAMKKLSETHSPEIAAQIYDISTKLSFLGFPAVFTRVVEGPVVKTFYFKPQEEFRFQGIFSRAEDIAAALEAESVRIERVYGECAISVPRKDRQLISFDKCLHELLKNSRTKGMILPLLMGQSTEGEYIHADLAAQPHMLIGGATGAGKSVFTAQLICSLALYCAPEILDIILVDTKNLDLVLFKELPHVQGLYSDIDAIREMLKKLLEEIRNRNALMSGVARSIHEWNALWKHKMKCKVVVIDELADIVDTDRALLSTYPKAERPVAIETLLKNIAQISRASGIHLIIATQRPSIKITSGDFKANLPARICFKLPTATDSRVILDETGAESLLGLGDYLYKISGHDVVKRGHSAFVSIDNIKTVISQHEFIRRNYEIASVL